MVSSERTVQWLASTMQEHKGLGSRSMAGVLRNLKLSFICSSICIFRFLTNIIVASLNRHSYDIFKHEVIFSVPGGSFGRRLSLASLGGGKYELIGDSYGGERGTVIVRHVPIVIEGSEGESDNKAIIWSSSPSPVWTLSDDSPSLSSRSSDNSVETSRRKEGGSPGYQSWDDWRRIGRKEEAVEMGRERGLRTSFNGIVEVSSLV